MLDTKNLPVYPNPNIKIKVSKKKPNLWIHYINLIN